MVISGKPNIGIASQLAKEIAEEVDVIINSVANTIFDERLVPRIASITKCDKR